KVIELEAIDMGAIENLLFNILPGGQTLLHLIADQEDFLKPIIEEAHPEVQNNLTIKYYTPIMPDFEGKTVLHLLLEAKQNKMANTILNVLKLYSLDHHSRAIKDIFPEFISRQLTNLFDYMDSRFI